jgi:hypothetical protein
MTWKLATTVRRGRLGKVLHDSNSLGRYPTLHVSVTVQAVSCRTGRGSGGTTQALVATRCRISKCIENKDLSCLTIPGVFPPVLQDGMLPLR